MTSSTDDKPSDFGGLCFCRVVVVGANGAGKTWLAQRLADRLDLPLISKDALALTTRWQQRSKADVSRRIAEQITGPMWVLEGGPSILMHEVLRQVDVVIWLDLPPLLRFRRILVRSLRYLGRTRPEHPPGNRDWPGLRQWRFAWRALRHGDRFANAVELSLAEWDGPVVRLRSRRDIDWFLESATT